MKDGQAMDRRTDGQRLEMKLLGLITLLIAAFGAATPVSGAVADSDLQVAARALSFMANPPTGPVRVGIVFDPSNPQSAADAAQLQRLMAGGFRVGHLTLQPLLVPADAVGTAQVALFFLTEGAGAAGRLAGATRARRLPCVTVDLAKVRDGTCAIGVRSHPRVEILVNHAAAEASGIRFSTSFRMLITEF
jgi:hypothetical protein